MGYDKGRVDIGIYKDPFPWRRRQNIHSKRW
jgi:hypothetical protein